MIVNIITNGLLLTREVVDRLTPYGLNGVKITLDGDRATHDRMRPLRGGQGTFDRIVANIRQVAHKPRLAIGGNFDMRAPTAIRRCSTSSEQDFADGCRRWHSSQSSANARSSRAGRGRYGQGPRSSR